MTTVRQILDRGAVIAWSPVKELPDFLAVGTKVRRVAAAPDARARATSPRARTRSPALPRPRARGRSRPSRAGGRRRRL